MNTDNLKAHWEGARDIWSSVPDDGETRNIQNRVLRENDDNRIGPQNWPKVVRDSLLYGMGAYNPLGQMETEEYNIRHHNLLRSDVSKLGDTLQLRDGLVWWEAASIFADGGMEPGFIIALNKKILSPDRLQQGEEGVVNLAKKYQQGAIYKFEFQQAENKVAGKLIRSTVPVLVPDTDATVEVIMDDSRPFPTSLLTS